MTKFRGATFYNSKHDLPLINRFLIIALFLISIIPNKLLSQSGEPADLNFTNTSSLNETASDHSVRSLAIPDTTLPPTPKPKLLPQNISFLERTFWSEKGIFREIGLASPLTPQSRMNELKLRRTMLTAHQIGGFTTLGLMLATCYYGQKIIDNGNAGRRKYGDIKETLVGATITSYSITALLALLSPPPMIRRDEFSTTSLHKTLAWVHVAGMIITPILAGLISERGSLSKAHAHQIAGYITTAAFATAMIVITF